MGHQTEDVHSCGPPEFPQACINSVRSIYKKLNMSLFANKVVICKASLCRLLVQEFNKSEGHAPWAVYHVPSGTVYLDKQ